MKTDDVFLKNQIKIAKDTLKLNNVGVMMLGGMSKEQARDILIKNGVKFHE